MEPGRLSFLQSVLSYSTAQTNTSEKEPPKREISPEKREFLNKFFNTVSINPIDEVKKCMKCLEDQNETQERHLEAIQTLRDWCEDLNFAQDFLKLDGYKLAESILKTNQNEEMRSLACDLIGSLAQNNEHCQNKLIQHDVMPLLIEKLNHDLENVKIKALFAISCLTRDFEPGQESLLNNNGIDALTKAVQMPIEKLQIKACFLISSVCRNPTIKHEFTKKQVLAKLIDMYRQNEHNIHEHVLSAITTLIDDNPEAIRQAKEMHLDFKAILTQRLVQIENDPSFEEEKCSAISLMESLFKN